MARSNILWRNLGLELDDVLTTSEQRKSLFCSPYGTSKGAGQHNPFKAESADAGGQSEQAVAKFDFGRFFNEENGVKLTKGHSGPPLLKTSERREVPPSSVNESITTARYSLSVPTLAGRAVAPDTLGPLSTARYAAE